MSIQLPFLRDFMCFSSFRKLLYIADIRVDSVFGVRHLFCHPVNGALKKEKSSVVKLFDDFFLLRFRKLIERCSYPCFYLGKRIGHDLFEVLCIPFTYGDREFIRLLRLGLRRFWVLLDLFHIEVEDALYQLLGRDSLADDVVVYAHEAYYLLIFIPNKNRTAFDQFALLLRAGSYRSLPCSGSLPDWSI